MRDLGLKRNAQIALLRSHARKLGLELKPSALLPFTAVCVRRPGTNEAWTRVQDATLREATDQRQLIF